jgi:hypothetical protein
VIQLFTFPFLLCPALSTSLEDTMDNRQHSVAPQACSQVEPVRHWLMVRGQRRSQSFPTRTLTLGAAEISAREASRLFDNPCDVFPKEHAKHAFLAQRSAQFPDHAVVEKDDEQDDLERPEMRPHDLG